MSFKRIQSLFLAIMIIAASCISGITAVAESEEITWNSFDSLYLASVSSDKSRVTLTSKVGNSYKSIYITFPSCGGVRLYAGDGGYFKPEALSNVTELSKINKSLSVTNSDNSITAVIDYSVTPWTLKIYDSSNNLTAALNGSGISLGYNSSGVVSRVKFEGSISGDEAFYGMGERFDSFILNGKAFNLYNTDDWSTNAYKNIPILHSSKGYTVFYNTPAIAKVDIGSSNPNLYSVDFEDDVLDMYLWAGNPIDNIKAYTELTGKPLSSPKWAYRYWAGANSDVWNVEGQNTNVLSDTLSNYKNRYGIDNLAAIYGEDSLFRYDETYNILNSYNGTRVLGWNNPYFSLDEFAEQNPQLSSEPIDNQYPAFRSPDGTVYITDGNGSAYLDFSHPKAYEVMEKRWGSYIDKGLKGLMLDYGEHTPTGVRAYNTQSDAKYRNFYSYDYTKTFYEIFNSRLNGDFVLFCRSAAAGSQKYAALFGGDQKGDFEGLNKAISALLSISTCGFSDWGSDIGGLAKDHSTADSYMRWMQFGAFSPLMRLHGSQNPDPWDYGAQSEENFKLYYQIRENLVDKIYSSSLKANADGIPMSQAMAVAFPNQGNLTLIDDQYMFCDDFLVAPVLTEGASSRNVILPGGNWVDFWNGNYINGDTTVNADASDNKMPVYIKGGSVIPMKVNPNSLSFTDYSDIGGESSSALVITAPDADRIGEFYNDKENITKYQSKATSNRAFAVTADKAQATKLLLIYGAQAQSVSVDGTVLQPLSAKPVSDSDIGFYSENSITYVRVSDSWNSVNITLSSYAGNPELSVSTVIPVEQENRENVNIALNSDISDSFDIYYGESAGVDGLAKTSFNERFTVNEGRIEHKFDNSKITAWWDQQDSFITTAIYKGGMYKDFEMSFNCIGDSGGTPYYWPMLVFGVTDPEKWVNQSGGGYTFFTYPEGTISYKGVFDGTYVWKDDGINRSANYADRLTNGFFVDNCYGWFNYKVRVENKKATFTVDPLFRYPEDANQDWSFSYTIDLGSDYVGGFVGFGSTGQKCKFKDFKITEISPMDNYDYSSSLADKTPTLFSQNGNYTYFTAKPYYSFDTELSFNVNNSSWNASLIFGAEKIGDSDSFKVSVSEDGAALKGIINGRYTEFAPKEAIGELSNGSYRLRLSVRGYEMTLELIDSANIMKYSASYPLGNKYSGGFIGYSGNLDFTDFDISDLGYMIFDSGIAGDHNSDGLLTADDIAYLVKLLLNQISTQSGMYSDINHDGVIDLLDLVSLKKHIAGN